MDREQLLEHISQLQDFFNEKLLAELLPQHLGEWALVNDFQLVGLYPTSDAAYTDSVSRFGLDAPICIAQVEPLERGPTSASWDFALL